VAANVPPTIEHVDDAAHTLVECERARERLAVAVSGRVDQHHPVPAGEVLGLGRPHAAGHQQAGPEQDRVSITAGAPAEPAKCGVDHDAIQLWVHVVRR
jgi:hypothetical protein